MLIDAACDGTAEIDGNRIANQPPEHRETHLAVLRNERIVMGKALQDRSFPERDGSILLGVADVARLGALRFRMQSDVVELDVRESA